MSSHVDYYVSLNSPWTHLGGTRLTEIATRCGATVRIHPIDAGSIFSASGGLPLPKRSPQRQAYRLQELARWRDALGIPIHIQPRHFPFHEAGAAHCVLVVRETVGDGAAIDLAHRVLKALWEEEADPSDRQTLVRLIGEIGLDGTSILELADDGRWATLRSRETQAAIERGVFGVPTYAVDREIFWGQDRLGLMERHLRAGG